MSGILVITEQRGGAWNRMSFETLAAGQQLASELGQSASAAVPGHKEQDYFEPTRVDACTSDVDLQLRGSS